MSSTRTASSSVTWSGRKQGAEPIPAQDGGRVEESDKAVARNMDWNDLLTGLALYLVLEGLLPFLSPEGWRRSMSVIAELPVRQLRIFGLASMLAGLALLVFVRGGT